MRKEKSAAVMSAIVLATAIFNLSTAVANLANSAVKTAPSPPVPVLAQACPAPAAPQVIQYLNLSPLPGEPDKRKEPSRPAGQ